MFNMQTVVELIFPPRTGQKVWQCLNFVGYIVSLSDTLYMAWISLY